MPGNVYRIVFIGYGAALDLGLGDIAPIHGRRRDRRKGAGGIHL